MFRADRGHLPKKVMNPKPPDPEPLREAKPEKKPVKMPRHPWKRKY
jgi:hypothetical protein